VICTRASLQDQKADIDRQVVRVLTWAMGNRYSIRQVVN